MSLGYLPGAHREDCPAFARLATLVVVTRGGGSKEDLLPFHDEQLARFDEAETLTAVGDVPGTLAYISPERLRGAEAEPASDVWAVGVLLWEALAGKHPFWGVPLPQMPALLIGELQQAARPVTRGFAVADSGAAETELLRAAQLVGPLGATAGLQVTWTLRMRRDQANIDHQQRLQADARRHRADPADPEQRHHPGEEAADRERQAVGARTQIDDPELAGKLDVLPPAPELGNVLSDVVVEPRGDLAPALAAATPMNGFWAREGQLYLAAAVADNEAWLDAFHAGDA